MYSKKKLSEVFGPSDEGFRVNFDNTLEKLRTEGDNRRAARMPRKMTAILIAACLIVLGGVAYAVSKISMQFVNRVDDIDIGAVWQMVAVPEDFWGERDTTRREIVFYRYDVPKEKLLKIDPEREEVLRGDIGRAVFSADGEPFDLLVPIPDTFLYCADDRGNVLYNIDGEEIAEICYVMIGYTSPPNGLYIETKAEEDRRRQGELRGENGAKITSDYAEAARLLGRDFRLPAAHTESMDAPEYRLQGLPYIQDGVDLNKDEGLKVFVTMKDKPRLFYFAEVPREGDAVPLPWYAEGAVIEECTLEDKTVYRIINDGLVRYTWEHDGLVYMLFQDLEDPGEFTDEQFVEIIWSMIQ